MFGKAACLSSTFGYADDLYQRVAGEPRRPVRYYLDSGWPDDNFDRTPAMRDLLVHRGYEDGKNLRCIAFPGATHDETSWAARCHVPFKFLFGKVPAVDTSEDVARASPTSPPRPASRAS